MGLFRKKAQQAAAPPAATPLGDPEGIYGELIAGIRARLDGYEAFNPIFPSADPPTLFDRDLGEKVNLLTERHPATYTKSRFLGFLLNAVWELQFKVMTEAMTARPGTPVRPRRESLAEMLDSPAARQSLIQGIGGAISMLARDPDVDLDVARDLGRGDGYPSRVAMPAKGSTTDSQAAFFEAGHERVALFWKTVLPVPLPGFLAPAAARAEPREASTGAAAEAIRNSRDEIVARVASELSKGGEGLKALTTSGVQIASSGADGKTVVVDWPVFAITVLIQEASGLPPGPARDEAAEAGRSSAQRWAAEHPEVMAADLADLAAHSASMLSHVGRLADACIEGFVERLSSPGP